MLAKGQSDTLKRLETRAMKLNHGYTYQAYMNESDEVEVLLECFK